MTTNRRLAFAFFFLMGIGSSQAAEAISSEQLLADVNQRITNIDTPQLQSWLAEHPETLVIDVRSRREIILRGGSIDAPNTVNIPRGWVEFRIADQAPELNQPIVVYCGQNLRSPLVADALQAMGYTQVKNYAGGFFAWQKAGLPVDAGDLALDSMLYDKPRQVVENVWSAIGETAPPSYENSGHNNNLSFIVTSEGVVVVNAGDNYLLARALHEEIRKVTDQPVKYVILENGQGHAVLGMNYWQEIGAKVIAHVDAAAELEAHGPAKLDRMRRRSGDKAMGTVLSAPDQTFEDHMTLELGGEKIEILHLGPAHSPGDTQVWLPEHKLVIAGDIAFHQRMPTIFDDTDTAGWLETWPKLVELGAETVIPGHGEPTDMAHITVTTHDYLVFLRGEIEKLLDEGETLQAAYQIDQSAYAHLDTYRELARSNAGRVFRAMEFE